MVQIVVDGSSRCMPLKDKKDPVVWVCSWSYMVCSDEPVCFSRAIFSKTQLTCEQVALLEVAKRYPESMWPELSLIVDQLTLVETIQRLVANPTYDTLYASFRKMWADLIRATGMEGITADAMMRFCFQARWEFKRSHGWCVEMEYADYLCDQSSLAWIYENAPECLFNFSLDGIPPYKPLSYKDWQSRGLRYYDQDENTHAYCPVAFTGGDADAVAFVDTDTPRKLLIADLTAKGYEVRLLAKPAFKRACNAILSPKVQVNVAA